MGAAWGAETEMRERGSARIDNWREEQNRGTGRPTQDSDTWTSARSWCGDGKTEEDGDWRCGYKRTRAVGRAGMGTEAPKR